MPLVKWDDKLSVNVAEIDAQHQKLVSMINELHEAMKLGKGKEVLDNILHELATYAVQHFGTEEKYFEQFGYPKSFPHKREHQAFAEKVTGFISSSEEGRAPLTMDVMNFLKDWLVNHIQMTDKQYGPFFNSHGLN